MFQEMLQVCVYMYNLVIISNDTYRKHMGILYDILKQIEGSVIQVNALDTNGPMIQLGI